jgi:acyl-CoA synthetase (AMP-forming)/AMP-acid ligase II
MRMNPPPNENIAAQLPVRAGDAPDALAVAVQHVRDGKSTYSQYTLGELEAESNRLARALRAYGIEDGMRTVLMVTPSLEFFALTFALFKMGAVPVFVDPGMGLRNLKTCLAQAEPETFIGIPKAQIARVLMGWGKPTVRKILTVGKRLGWGGATLDCLRHSVQDGPFEMVQRGADDMAAILFTSGSTGVPKGAVYTHGVFNAQIEILRNDYGIQPGEKDLATFPLFALFGPALGMAAIVPDMDASRPARANPAHIVAAIQDHAATNLFASPALIDVVGAYGEQEKISLTSLRRVISAGAPARAESIARFTKLLAAGVEVFPSYGATEALPVAYIGSKEFLEDTTEATQNGAGVCVGRPVTDVGVAVIRISDAPIAEWSEGLICGTGTIGEIVVRGPVVTHEYYRHPEATAAAKIHDPKTDTLCHRMGDVGYFDDTGRLWMCGRKAHRIETDGRTLFTIPCERIFDTHPAVRRTALVGVRRCEQVLPVLCVERNASHRDWPDERVALELLALAARHEQTRPIQEVLFHKSFPVDVRHNAKIFREKLAVWASGRISQ